MRVWNKLAAALVVSLCLFAQPTEFVFAAPAGEDVQTAESVHGEWDGPLSGLVAPSLNDGEVQAELLGTFVPGVREDQLQSMRVASADGIAMAEAGEQIPDNEYNAVGFIYINGEPYRGGDIDVTEGDNFSYAFSWSPVPEKMGGDPWSEGDWFEVSLFTVPGLNLPTRTEANLVIDGIKVGTWEIEYDSATGEATYRVVFTRYMQFLDPKTVLAYVQGSGKFTEAGTSGTIDFGGESGTLTINPRPAVPSVPEVEGGTGWQPSQTPSFNDDGYGFGKGVKWTSGTNLQMDPQIEWRVVFFEQLQKLQREFAESGDASVLEQSKGYLIVEDTLDSNQRFYHPSDAEYHGEGKTHGEDCGSSVPFFIELPMIVPGTGAILNSTYGVGDASSYDGPGLIHTVVRVDDYFVDLTHSDVDDFEVKKKVEQTPLTWAVITDPQTRRETLVVNMGKLGATDDTDGLTWGSAEDTYWPIEGLKDRIDECDRKINALRTGEDSPISLMDKRQGALLNLLRRAASLQDDPTAANEGIVAWEENYRTWRKDPAVAPLLPLKDPNGNIVVPLPDVAMAKGFEGWKADDSGKAIFETGEYRDYIASLENLLADQEVYLANRTEYGKGWEQAKRYYEQALGFHEAAPGIFGFALKVRTESINTSSTTYGNSVNVRLDGKSWAATDEASVTFGSGIMGSYSLGDVVIQKADAQYDTGNAEDDIKLVEDDQAGLAGAKFQVYCGEDTSDEVPELTEQNLAHFLDKDASDNGATYRYAHKGGSHEGAGAELGMVDTLVTAETDDGNNKKGRIALGGIVPVHSHWLVETEAPAGYYLDRTPRRIESARDKVTYEFAPNVSRSVLLAKVDSFSENPVAGATFALYRKVDGKEERVTGFDTVTVNGHETLWKSADGSGEAVLATNDDGVLCIHGLDAGTYVLREEAPAPGYLMPRDMPEYTFTLHDELPSNDGAARYDDAGHLLLTALSPLQNDPGTAKLTVKKRGEDGGALEGAGFSLFRFTGTEEQWRNDPDDQDLWKPVSPSKDGVEGRYFKTENELDTVVIDDGGDNVWSGELTAVLSGSDGSLGITDIPVGHYSIAETKVPTGEYFRDYRSFYFTVDGDAVDTDLKLYLEPQEKNELQGNVLVNYQKRAQIALVKYDAARGGCGIEGEPDVNGGWRYSDDRLNQAKGLAGAVYKLFMRSGASIGVVNPYPLELLSEKIVGHKPGYDACLAVGTTDENGVLRLSDMKDRNGAPVSALNPEDYYMVEVTPPSGYLLDQDAVEFKIDEKVLSGGGDAPGLIMAASNEKVDYGFRMRKVAAQAGDGASAQGVAGAGFEVSSEGKVLSFKRDLDETGRYGLADDGSEGAVSTVYTGADGLLDLRGLAGGASYVLTETVVPLGFKQPKDPVTVTVTLPTKVGSGEGALEGGVLYPSEETVVENEKLLGTMSLRKVDAETFEPLAGARFGLYRTDVTVIPPDDPMYDPQHPDATHGEDVLVREGVTDKDGDLTFGGLEWAPYYYVQEIEAPEGYVLDETKYAFSIDEYSFDSSGNPIEVQFPFITNSVGTIGHAILTKVDAESGDALPDAHFFLEKYMGTDASGKETWVGYGKGVYVTDADGEIGFWIPPGQYRLTELKAPDGYINDAKMVEFEIEEGDPGVVVIDDGDGDGVIGNVKGETGVLVKKTLGISDAPVPGVTFNIGWEVMNPDLSTELVPLNFMRQSEGKYSYTADPGAPNVTTRLVTDGNGEISVLLPKGLEYPGTALASFACWEADAPDGLVVDATVHYPKLVEGIYSEIRVANDLNPTQRAKLAIDVRKTDGKSKKGMEGAQFELRWCAGGSADDNCEDMPPLAVGVTDKDGNLTFKEADVTAFPGLLEGETYHIVETKAPEGYVLSQAHHELTLDKTCFDDEFNFTGATVNVANYRTKGAVELTKVSADDASKALPGAEFELFELVADIGGEPHWVHCGEHRYVTGEDGGLRIDELPYGTYKLVETAAPWGYVLDDPAWEREFSIEVDGTVIDLGAVENAPDPNPVRDVRVKKVAAHDNGLALPGAEFQLYARNADGSYGLAHAETLTTDSAGEFTIEGLPVGSYALKEVRAPEGYEMPRDNLTEFAVRAEDRAVELEIENARAAEEQEPVSVSVLKQWDDGDDPRRPGSVTVQLHRNGDAYGPAVKLSAQDGWEYRWNGLDARCSWSVDEVDVPDGYQRHVSNDGHDWLIVNEKAQGGTPPTIEDPGDEDPGDEEGSEGQEGHGDGDAGDPGEDHDGETGDGGVDSDPDGGAGHSGKPGFDPDGQGASGNDVASGGANAHPDTDANGKLAGTGDESVPFALTACAGALLAAVGMGLRPRIRGR